MAEKDAKTSSKKEKKEEKNKSSSSSSKKEKKHAKSAADGDSASSARSRKGSFTQALKEVFLDTKAVTGIGHPSAPPPPPRKDSAIGNAAATPPASTSVPALAVPPPMRPQPPPPSPPNTTPPSSSSSITGKSSSNTSTGALGSISQVSEPMLRQHDHEYKIILIGPSSVGKTSIRWRICGRPFEPNGMTATVGMDFESYYYEITEGTRKQTIRLSMWDTAGQEQYKSLVRQYYRGSHGIFCVYDVCSQKSYESLVGRGGMLAVAQEEAPEALIMVVGNKIDLPNRTVAQDMVASFCTGNNFLYFETSAKNNINIKEALEGFAAAIHTREQKKKPINSGGSSSSTSAIVKLPTSAPLAIPPPMKPPADYAYHKQGRDSQYWGKQETPSSDNTSGTAVAPEKRCAC